MVTKANDRRNIHVRALEDANLMYEATRARVSVGTKWGKARQLSQYGIFTDLEISNMLDVSVASVRKALMRQPDISAEVPTHHGGEHGYALVGESVFALLALAKQYHERNMLSSSLLRLVFSSYQSSMVSLTRLTGIPKEILRGVLHGASYMSGVLIERS